MKIKEFWNRFKELIAVLAGIATIATFVIIYWDSDSEPTTKIEDSTIKPGTNVPEDQRKDIDSAQYEFYKRNNLN